MTINTQTYFSGFMVIGDRKGWGNFGLTFLGVIYEKIMTSMLL